MLVIPAIDLKDGKCVRLRQGKEEDKTVYSDDPVAVARHWERSGAQRLHVVDLDGAFSGLLKNWEVVKKIREAISIPIELGGGLRTLEAIGQVLDSGVDYVVLGSVLVSDPALGQEAAGRHGAKIIAGVDARGDRVSIKGWKEESTVTILELAARLRSWGIEQMIYTDISRDGMMDGPNLEKIKEVARLTRLQIIASGGVSSLGDVKSLAALEADGVIGMIVGKALYTGDILLEDALKLC